MRTTSPGTDGAMSSPNKPPSSIGAKRFFERLAAFQEETPAQIAERKALSARCGHVKRRLVRHEALKGELLEFAIGIVGENHDLAEKLRTGQRLSEYELHLMLDVFLLRARLGGVAGKSR